MSETDRIEKKILLRAPKSRVWRAISDAEELGAWFGMDAGGAFVAGATLNATIRPTTVDPDVAAQQEAHAGTRFQMIIDEVVPERRLVFRWHPYAPGADLASEPMTTVVFELDDAPGGVVLTITESGFDRIPLARRAEAFTSNDAGWSAQLRMIEKYLAA